ncbi:MAG: (2Fe-2S)-binding protein [Phycisphaerae bacterium]|nr:(2Fe-2S)-binding protein [Phycisphaerae bacterium]
MSKHLTLSVNGRSLTVPEGTVLAVALAEAGVTQFRRSVKGQARGPLCGMGICFECSVTIDGKLHQRSCQTLCQEGMEVTTDE